jgi:hypothetical protein
MRFWRSKGQGFVGWGRYFFPHQFGQAVLAKQDRECCGLITARNREGRENGWVLLYSAPGPERKPLAVSGRDVLILDKDGAVVRKPYDMFRTHVRAMSVAKTGGAKCRPAGVEILTVTPGDIVVEGSWDRDEEVPAEFAQQVQVLRLPPEKMI